MGWSNEINKQRTNAISTERFEKMHFRVRKLFQNDPQSSCIVKIFQFLMNIGDVSFDAKTVDKLKASIQPEQDN